MAALSYPFTTLELARLGRYREAVRAGFYHEGWGSEGPDRPVQAKLVVAQPLAPEAAVAWRRRTRALARVQRDRVARALQRLGVIRERIYLQDTPSGGLVFVYAEVRAFGELPGPSFDRQLLAIHDLEPGQPGPAGSAALVLEWEHPDRCITTDRHSLDDRAAAGAVG